MSLSQVEAHAAWAVRCRRHHTRRSACAITGALIAPPFEALVLAVRRSQAVASKLVLLPPWLLPSHQPLASIQRSNVAASSLTAGWKNCTSGIQWLLLNGGVKVNNLFQAFVALPRLLARSVLLLTLLRPCPSLSGTRRLCTLPMCETMKRSLQNYPQSPAPCAPPAYARISSWSAFRAAFRNHRLLQHLIGRSVVRRAHSRPVFAINRRPRCMGLRWARRWPVAQPSCQASQSLWRRNEVLCRGARNKACQRWITAAARQWYVSVEIQGV